MSKEVGSVLSQETPAQNTTSNTTENTTSNTTSSGAPASWRDSLPDDLKAEKSLAMFNDVGALAKSYIHAQKMVGAEKIAIPGKHATDEDYLNVFKKLGLPESVDKYEVKAAEGLDAETISGFKEQALKAGILPNQAQKLLDWYHGQSSAKMTAAQERLKSEQAQALDGLKKEWGQGWDKNVAAAKAAVAEFGGDELKQFLNQTGLGNHPLMIKLMSKIGSALAEDKIQGQGDLKMGLTPAEAKTQVNTILADMKHPYHDKNHPNHKAAVADVQKLFEAMAG